MSDALAGLRGANAMETFNPENKEHKAIVIAAMVNADILGAGRLTAAKEQLEMNDIKVDSDTLSRCVCSWGQEISWTGR